MSVEGERYSLPHWLHQTQLLNSLSRINMVYRKLVIVGDKACGKTCLLTVFTLGQAPEVCAHAHLIRTLRVNTP